jgi:hypothetical protein
MEATIKENRGGEARERSEQQLQRNASGPNRRTAARLSLPFLYVKILSGKLSARPSPAVPRKGNEQGQARRKIEQRAT